MVSGIKVLTGPYQTEDRMPVTIISTQINIDSMTKGFKAGVDDYVKKLFNTEELLLRTKAKTMIIKERAIVHGYTWIPVVMNCIMTIFFMYERGTKKYFCAAFDSLSKSCE